MINWKGIIEAAITEESLWLEDKPHTSKSWTKRARSLQRLSHTCGLLPSQIERYAQTGLVVPGGPVAAELERMAMACVPLRECERYGLVVKLDNVEIAA